MANNGMKTPNIDGNKNALARPCLVSRLLSIPVTLTISKQPCPVISVVTVEKIFLTP
jgi:hypothetical protein